MYECKRNVRKIRDVKGISVCVQLYVCLTEAKEAGEVCPRETTLGEEEVVGGQAEEK